MAEEDLIFGKNRHFFGGIEPSNMRKFTANAYSGKVRLECQLPLETTINGQILCSVAGAIIRKKTTGYPKDEFDGELVADIKTSGYIIDQNSSINSTYYYAAFPYTGQGVYNRSPNNRALFNQMTDGYLYGYDLNLEDSNPNTRVSYPPDVMNYNYTPAYMNYSTGVFNYGSWPSTHGDTSFMPRPCMLKFDGTVLHYLNPNDYTKQYNSTSSSSVATLSSNANAMMEWPKIYIHRELVNNVYKFRCSNIKYDSDWDCWCNYDVNNHVIDHFYTGIYPGIMKIDGYTDQLRSISGVTIQSARGPAGISNYYYDYYMKCAYNNNSGSNGSIWDVEVLSDRMLIQDLLVMMARTTDCKTAYGKGSAMDGVKTNGTMNTKGLFWGSNTTTNGVKIFGMENWWGNRYRLMNGLAAHCESSNISNMKFKITKGTHDGSTKSSYTDKNSSSYIPAYNYYKNLENVIFGSGYIDGMNFVSPYGRLYPNSFNGSSSTYECDFARTTLIYNYNDYKVAYVNSDGPFSIRFDSYESRNGQEQEFADIRGDHTCATLSCKPIKS